MLQPHKPTSVEPTKMLATSISTRSVIFVYLVGPPKTLSRRDGMEVHDAVCRKLGSDDFSFQYNAPDAQPPAAGKAFQIVLERSQGRGKFKVLVDNKGLNQPVRLYAESEWPRSAEVAFEDIDLAMEAASDVLGDGWTRVLAEARIKSQVEAKGDSAAGFLAKEMLHLSAGDLDSLGAPLSFLGLKYETEAAHPAEGDPLANPRREVTVEVLRADPRCLYVELMSQWPQVAMPVPAAGGTIQLDASKIRSFSSVPNEYLRNTAGYLNSVVLPLFAR